MSSIFSPRPPRPPKRCFQENNYAAPSKRQRLPSPSETPNSNILAWLTEVATTLPSNSALVTTNRPLQRRHSAPVLPTVEMNLAPRINESLCSSPISTQPSLKRVSTASPSPKSVKSSTKESLYREILANNDIYIDYLGKELPESLLQLKAEILDQAKAIMISDKNQQIIKNSISIAIDENEGFITRLVPLLFDETPERGDEFHKSGDTLWTPLPVASASRRVVTPKADVHYSYKRRLGKDSVWSREQDNFFANSLVTPILRPDNKGILPFLISELKSEATGGTLWQAENQAASAGTQCVMSMRWLAQQAFAKTGDSSFLNVFESIAISICMSPRVAAVYVHFYSEEDNCYYMSGLEQVFLHKLEGIQVLRAVYNWITDYALTTRLSNIRKWLDVITPISPDWQPLPTPPAVVNIKDDESRPTKLAKLASN